MTDDDAHLILPEDPASSITPGGLIFGIQFAETGTLGGLRIADSTWRGFAHRYTAAGSEPGVPFEYVWWYKWNGRFFVPDTRIDPPPPPRRPSFLVTFVLTILWGWIIAMPAGGLAGPDFTPGATAAIITWGCCWATTYTIAIWASQRRQARAEREWTRLVNSVS